MVFANKIKKMRAKTLFLCQKLHIFKKIYIFARFHFFVVTDSPTLKHQLTI